MLHLFRVLDLGFLRNCHIELASQHTSMHARVAFCALEFRNVWISVYLYLPFHDEGQQSLLSSALIPMQQNILIFTARRRKKDQK